MNENPPRDYTDIIDLPHPTSRTHPRMSMLNRAAQFAPFAALNGYEEVIRDQEKIVYDRVILSADEINDLKHFTYNYYLAASADDLMTSTYSVEGNYYSETRSFSSGLSSDWLSFMR